MFNSIMINDWNVQFDSGKVVRSCNEKKKMRRKSEEGTSE